MPSLDRIKLPQWTVGVVIPACNEESTVFACIESVHDAIYACSDVRDAWTVVVADSCTDRTASRARRALAGRGEVIETSARSAGTARRLGVTAQLARFDTLNPATLWLASTDADTWVAEDWLQRQIELAQTSSVAVAGIVEAVAAGDISAEVLQSLLRDYEVFADGTHPHVHGANMGIRADAYLDAGGWSDKNVAEDHCLWDRLKQRGWPVTSSTAVRVNTSGRLLGRAAGGFADRLRLKFERLASPTDNLCTS